MSSSSDKDSDKLLDALSVDYKEIPKDEREKITEFLKHTASALHELTKKPHTTLKSDFETQLRASEESASKAVDAFAELAPPIPSKEGVPIPFEPDRPVTMKDLFEAEVRLTKLIKQIHKGSSPSSDSSLGDDSEKKREKDETKKKEDDDGSLAMETTDDEKDKDEDKDKDETKDKDESSESEKDSEKDSEKESEKKKEKHSKKSKSKDKSKGKSESKSSDDSDSDAESSSESKFVSDSDKDSDSDEKEDDSDDSDDDDDEEEEDDDKGSSKERKQYKKWEKEVKKLEKKRKKDFPKLDKALVKRHAKLKTLKVKGTKIRPLLDLETFPQTCYKDGYLAWAKSGPSYVTTVTKEVFSRGIILLEVVFDMATTSSSSTSTALGVADASWKKPSGWMGNDSDSMDWNYTGPCYHNSNSTSGNKSISLGDLIGAEVNLKKRTLHFFHSRELQTVSFTNIPKKIVFGFCGGSQNLLCHIVSMKRLRSTKTKSKKGGQVVSW
ncbi:uncharacterized protein MONOS_13842 [Monocercomonoides exilis]|uniref:uncharacterized protein n=1 Tax=Monocercomonoides exilis TaxID=2049356 RepID=UPI00355A6EE5|nr:hypothetical protein MONOS_13842 [Monocercomonoides exilis]|eukprot:MONOS_13842.1-p1 / transcript=MONOS_13842.1 / gene=MONOS_13842 / organism=Monocercomonoides_exilis_PA203 / gene_product=unspecified product / transcript_product=unspecified product / location=Mono_scaffold00892:17126-19258(-) / protein_length=497 / sequence_SO=supercontig / SO=protein_coding / is_pseudo=false